VVAPEPTSTGWRGPELRNTWQRQSSPLGNAEPGAMGHGAAPEPTSSGRRGLELRNTWKHVDACPAPCLNLELVCGVPSLQGADRGPRAHLGRGCEPAGGTNFSAPTQLSLSFYSAVDNAPNINVKMSMAGPREMPELKVRERHQQCENVNGGPPGGAGAEGPRAPTINVKTSTAGPREVPELKVRERPPST
jgi:hypothetical protein